MREDASENHQSGYSQCEFKLFSMCALCSQTARCLSHFCSCPLWSQWAAGSSQEPDPSAPLPALTASLGVPSPSRRPTAVSATLVWGATARPRTAALTAIGPTRPVSVHLHLRPPWLAPLPPPSCLLTRNLNKCCWAGNVLHSCCFCVSGATEQ